MHRVRALLESECTARHARIPKSQGECQLNRLQAAHVVVPLRIRPPKIPRRLLPLRGLPHLRPELWTTNCPPPCGTKILSGKVANGLEGCPVEPLLSSGRRSCAALSNAHLRLWRVNKDAFCWVTSDFHGNCMAQRRHTSGHRTRKAGACVRFQVWNAGQNEVGYKGISPFGVSGV